MTGISARSATPAPTAAMIAGAWDEAVCLSVLGRALQTYPDHESLVWFGQLADEQAFSSLRFIVRDESVADQARTVESDIGELTKHAAVGLSNLQIDHTALFVGPGDPIAPPWESVHASGEGLLFQTATRQVREWYHRFGIAVDEEGRVPDDHIGLELAFLGVLAARAAEASDSGSWAAARSSSSEFWRSHAGRWAPAFAETVMEKAQHPVHRGIAQLLLAATRKMNEIHGRAMPFPRCATV